MINKIKAPWSIEQVEFLNNWQKNPRFHPYTCVYRGDGNHNMYDGDLGSLLATENGWVCRDCDYTQLWAFDLGI